LQRILVNARRLTTKLSDLSPSDVDPYFTASFAYSIYNLLLNHLKSEVPEEFFL
jgi:hypothetical protein